MEDLNFIKKSLPFADGFELIKDTHQQWIEYNPENTIDKFRVDLRDLPVSFLFGDFFTRTIEGINKRFCSFNGRNERSSRKLDIFRKNAVTNW